MNANILAGWIGMALGILSGATIGVFFHRESFLGGYASHTRRLIRLGHIAFFGLGFMNLAFGLTVGTTTQSIPMLEIASRMFIAGAIAMPITCFLTAWRKNFRHLFPLPVVAVAGGIVILLIYYSEVMT